MSRVILKAASCLAAWLLPDCALRVFSCGAAGILGNLAFYGDRNKEAECSRTRQGLHCMLDCTMRVFCVSWLDGEMACRLGWP